MKICKKCSIEKDYSEYYKDKKSKDDHENTCILCRKYQKVIYWKNNKDKLTDKRKLFNENNKEHIKERQKKYYQENKEKISENKEKYKNNNKKKLRESSRRYRENNKEKVLNSNRIYKERKKECVIFKLTQTIRSAITKSLKRNEFTKNLKTKDIIGCSFEEFKLYIESKFEDWMTWENHGIYTGKYNETWQLDHIIPISHAITEDDVYKLNRFDNFQPLCSMKNLEKSNKFYDTYSMGNNSSSTI